MNTAPDFTCREVLDFLMAYLDGELPEDRVRIFERHLAVCPSCTAYLESYKATVRLAQREGADDDAISRLPVPDALARAIRAARGS